ncbi:hypothetical protein AB6A40_009838 [Gnathostoma spinigerum]|uniref:Uncharacterized protein n=1 Tax=Gnathostoma spinigerum TaxID=75299 RepID=A0ABD6ET31_9BILA
MVSQVPESYWKNLLLMAQSAKKQSASEEPDSAIKEMSAEDRKFLEEAMSEFVSKTDPAEHMKRCLSYLRSTESFNAESLAVVETIINILEEIVCQIDCGVNFCLLGGLVEIQRMLDSKCDKIREQSLRIIPSIAQHNAKAQDLIMKSEMLPTLMSIVVSNEESSAIRVRALSAVSAIVRAHDGALLKFRQLNGFVVLSDIFHSALAREDVKLANKAALIIASFAYDLGSEVSGENGLPTMIIHIFAVLPPTYEGSHYIREYLRDNVNLVKLDNNNKNMIRTTLLKQLENERKDQNEDNQETITEIENMLRLVDVKEK